MDTYIPTPSSGNILGGKSIDGELDGIQAWKKGMKEKEMKAMINESNGAESRQPIANDQLDEIQLFRLLMKREEEKKKSDNADAVAPLLGTPPAAVNLVTNLTDLQGPQVVKTSEGMLKSQQISLRLIVYPTDDSQKADVIPAAQGMAESRLDTKMSPLPHPEIVSPSARNPLPILDYKESPDSTPNPSSASLELSSAGSKAPLLSQGILSHASQEINVPDIERTPSAMPPQFNPPQGSRLLAFARTPSAAARPQAAVVSKLPNGMHSAMFC
jgi:hypothetical protein